MNVKMKHLFIGALVASGLSTSVAAETSGHIYDQYIEHPTGHVVYVSCFRGPWAATIWDHPRAIFLDSLVEVGYDMTTADAIGNRICSDVNLVNNEAALKAEMERIIAESPRYGRYR